MTDRAKPSFGTVMKMGPVGGALVTIPRTVSINPPRLSREAVDATAHDSPGGAMEVIGDGVYDPGELSGSMNYIAGDTTDDALITAATDGVLRDFSFTVKAATGTETIEFSGLLTNYGPDELATRGKQSASFTIKVSGPLSQAASA